MTRADLGRVEAELRSGRAFLFDAIGEIWDCRRENANTPITRDRPTCCRKAAEASAQAVNLLFRAAGVTALFERNPLCAAFETYTGRRNTSGRSC